MQVKENDSIYPKTTMYKKNYLIIRRIEEVVECLEDLQPTCHYYNEFFPFRHLVTSLRKSIDWVCTPEHLRSRFRSKQKVVSTTVFFLLIFFFILWSTALLNSFDCLETARRKASSNGAKCFHPHVPVNIWYHIQRSYLKTDIFTINMKLYFQFILGKE